MGVAKNFSKGGGARPVPGEEGQGQKIANNCYFIFAPLFSKFFAKKLPFLYFFIFCFHFTKLGGGGKYLPLSPPPNPLPTPMTFVVLRSHFGCITYVANAALLLAGKWVRYCYMMGAAQNYASPPPPSSSSY